MNAPERPPGGTDDVDAVVVGSGFGGVVVAQRLPTARLSVCVLERGKRYPPGAFPRAPHDMSRNFWDPSEGMHGLFIAASAYVEMAFEAIGLDLTPGASERNSSPEHIWTAARRWHHALAQAEQRGLVGSYVPRDKGCDLLDATVGGSEEQPPPDGAGGRGVEGGP